MAGSLVAMGRLLMDDPERDGEATVDRMTTDVLRALGVSKTEAKRLCRKRLPKSYDIALHSVVEQATATS